MVAQRAPMPEMIIQIDGERAYTTLGFRGIELRARPRAGPGAENVRALISFAETAKGRAALICLTVGTLFTSALPEFRAARTLMAAPA